MVVTFGSETMRRINAMQRERTARLAAKGHHLQVERDMITGGYIVRNPNVPARIEIVNDRGQCSCTQYRLWDRCKHAALVEVRHG